MSILKEHVKGKKPQAMIQCVYILHILPQGIFHEKKKICLGTSLGARCEGQNPTQRDHLSLFQCFHCLPSLDMSPKEEIN